MPYKLFNVTYEYIDDINPNGIETATDVVLEGHSKEFREIGEKRFEKFKIIKVEENKHIDIDEYGKPKKFELDKHWGSGHLICVSNKYYWTNWKEQYDTTKKLVEWIEERHPTIDTTMLWSFMKRLKSVCDDGQIIRQELTEKQVAVVNKMIVQYGLYTPFIKTYK